MKLNYKRTTLIGLAFMSILAFWQFYDQVIPYVMKYLFGLSDLGTNALMSIDNVLAIFMLPLFGMISDRTRSRLGRRTPYILYGTLLAVLLMIALAFSIEARHFLWFTVVLIALLVTMAIYRTPAVAYMPDVTPKPLRSKANAIINLVGYIGGIFATVMMMFLLKSEKTATGESVYAKDQTFMPIIFVIAAFMLITVLILVLSVHENRVVAEASLPPDEEETTSVSGKLPPPVRRSLLLILASVFLWYAAYNAVTTMFSRYCQGVLGADLSASSGYLLVATIAAIASFVPLGFLSGAVGRKKAVLLGVALMTVCYAVAFFVRQPSPLIYLLFALVGIGWASINVNSFPMVVEMSSGADVGKYTGYYYTFSMAAQIITPLLSGALITYLPGKELVLFPYAVVFSALAFFTMSLVKHGDVKPVTKKNLLENFDLED